MNKTPVVFIHAFPFDARMWRAQLDHLPADRRAFAPDLRGLGGSKRAPAALSVAQHAADILSLLDNEDVPSAAVVGLSLGGYVALAMHRMAPHRVSGLLLCDTKALPDTEEAKLGRDARIDRIRREGSGFIPDEMLPNLLWSQCADSLKRKVRGFMLEQHPDGLIDTLIALRDRPDASTELPFIKCPTTLLCGKYDSLTNPEMMRQMASAIEGSIFSEIPNAGHLSNLENPLEFNCQLDAFLARVDEKKV